MREIVKLEAIAHALHGVRIIPATQTEDFSNEFTYINDSSPVSTGRTVIFKVDGKFFIGKGGLLTASVLDPPLVKYLVRLY